MSFCPEQESKSLSCCFQQYLNCQDDAINNYMRQLYMSNTEIRRHKPFGPLMFDHLNAMPSLQCSSELDLRGNNNIRNNHNKTFESKSIEIINKNTFVNGPKCKTKCCYAPTHQLFMNLSKQHPEGFRLP